MSSRRRSPLPPDWRAIRAAVLDRDDHRCTWLVARGQRCTAPATDVDHIDRHDDHSPGNLRALCAPHHRERTALQANAIREARRHRPPERHPGLL